MIHWKDFDYSSLDLEDYTVKIVKDKITGDEEEERWSNIIFSFDCETTSFYTTEEGEIMMFDYTKTPEFYSKTTKGGVVYIWMVGINDKVVYGRDIAEYREFELYMSRLFRIRNSLHRVYYIHNLSFDFHWIQNALGTDFEVFARKKRRVMKAFNPYPWGIEFRCSYVLTNRTLKKCCEDYNLPVAKKVGDLDYNVMRTPLSQLTDKEMDYCEYDILAIYHLINRHLEEYTTLLKIPMTSTGKIRRQVQNIFYHDRKYKSEVTRMMPSTFKEFKLLCDVYSGGYTHASVLYSNEVMRNIYSYDIGSSYPYELVTKKYPMTAFGELNHTDLSKIDFENEAVIIDIEFRDLKSKIPMSFLSNSKIKNKEYVVGKDNFVLDNGRILQANRSRFILTDVDLSIVNQCYTFKGGFKIHKIYTAKKDYLDRRLIQFILNLYKDKTVLKGIEGMESKYNTSKEYINGSYGMMVMKIIIDEIIYEHGKWRNANEDENGKYDKDKALQAAMDTLNKLHSENKEVLNFAWGVWVSAYARNHLWKMILRDPYSVVYVDTDSVKTTKDFTKYIEEDTLEVKRAIADVCLARDLDPRDFKPKTSKGEEKMIGLFEEERRYREFKTLGAKKYAYTYEGEEGVFITVSGINKDKGRKYFDIEGRTIEDFKCGAYFDYKFAGKNGLYYIENQKPITMPDGYEVKTRFAINLMPTTYTLDMTPDYFDLVDSWSSGSKLLD